MTYGNHEQHLMIEVSIDALRSHCNLIYKALIFIGEEFLMNMILMAMIPDVPWAMRFQKSVSL